MRIVKNIALTVGLVDRTIKPVGLIPTCPSGDPAHDPNAPLPDDDDEEGAETGDDERLLDADKPTRKAPPTPGQEPLHFIPVRYTQGYPPQQC